jgi:hypothetical protein
MVGDGGQHLWRADALFDVVVGGQNGQMKNM